MLNQNTHRKQNSELNYKYGLWYLTFTNSTEDFQTIFNQFLDFCTLSLSGPSERD
jgi:hypothetical protein